MIKLSEKEIKIKLNKAIILKFGSLYLYAQKIDKSYQYVHAVVKGLKPIPSYMLEIINAKKYEVVKTTTYILNDGEDNKLNESNKINLKG